MGDLHEMNRLLQEASQLLRQAVDIGTCAREAGREACKVVDSEWEEFLAGFLRHLRQRGRERGVNLLAGISFARILRGVR